MYAGTILSRQLSNWDILCKLDLSLLEQIVILKVFGFGTGAIFVTSRDDVFKIGDYFLDDVTKNKALSVSQVEELCGKKVIKFDSGHSHLVALTKDGHVFTCGRNFRGQLGTGDTIDRSEFLTVKIPEGENVADVVCSSNSTVLLTRSGKVFTWIHSYKQISKGGPNRFKELVLLICLDFPDGVTISTLACGSDHMAALSKTGQVYAWGCNYHGCLGVKSHLAILQKPKLVLGLNRVTKIACGMYYTVVLTSGGKVRLWGSLWGLMPHFSGRTVATSPIQIKELQRIRNVYAMNNSNEIWATTNTGVYASTRRAINPYWRKRMFKMFDNLADAFSNSATPCFTVQVELTMVDSKFQTPSHLVIVAGSSVIPVHRKVLRKKCHHFWKLFRRRLKNNCFTVTDYPPKVFEAFIKFLYTNVLDPLSPRYLIELFILSKSYKQDDLKCAVMSDYSKCLSVDNVVHLFEEITLSGAHELLPITLCYVTRYFPHVLSSSAFKSLDDKLAKDLVIKVAESPEIHNYSYSFFNMY